MHVLLDTGELSEYGLNFFSGVYNKGLFADFKFGFKGVQIQVEAGKYGANGIFCFFVEQDEFALVVLRTVEGTQSPGVANEHFSRLKVIARQNSAAPFNSSLTAEFQCENGSFCRDIYALVDVLPPLDSGDV